MRESLVFGLTVVAFRTGARVPLFVLIFMHRSCVVVARGMVRLATCLGPRCSTTAGRSDCAAERRHADDAALTPPRDDAPPRPRRGYIQQSSSHRIIRGNIQCDRRPRAADDGEKLRRLRGCYSVGGLFHCHLKKNAGSVQSISNNNKLKRAARLRDFRCEKIKDKSSGLVKSDDGAMCSNTKNAAATT